MDIDLCRQAFKARKNDTADIVLEMADMLCLAIYSKVRSDGVRSVPIDIYGNPFKAGETYLHEVWGAISKRDKNKIVDIISQRGFTFKYSGMDVSVTGWSKKGDNQ